MEDDKVRRFSDGFDRLPEEKKDTLIALSLALLLAQNSEHGAQERNSDCGGK